jgi:hypothetical protein
VVADSSFSNKVGFRDFLGDLGFNSGAMEWRDFFLFGHFVWAFGRGGCFGRFWGLERKCMIELN